MPGEHKGRDWCDASVRQGTPKVASTHLEVSREAWNTSQSPEGTIATHTFISE